ncbi:SusC/RagA family TonB-linked outer membrane protein [uncultured Croceitalea sp.]|uniref:SusC/RagA family TonB-linked outer membrane protein n=1 Tax=uncultured Croceitalea sp. TaxID=1798908 RepID=UPI00374E3C91
MKRIKFKRWKNSFKTFLFAITMFVMCGYSFAQKTITGNVSDDSGPLPGATIVVKGTSNGTQADFDGNFVLNNVNEDDTLVFSYIGYASQEILVSGQSQMNVVLLEDTARLDEVVVVGYGTAKKSDLTGSVASVSAKDFEKQPLNDVSQALLGRAAGLQVTQNSGTPGGDFKIRIRGANSISGGNEPLFVVDGQFLDISAVNVNDIQSIEVLKDASATAIYGNRGANGVVLITTKRGRPGKATINVDVFTSISKPTTRLDLLNGIEFAEAAIEQEGVSIEDSTLFTQEQLDELRANGGEDWQDRLFRTGFANNVQVSASGGSEDIDYYISSNFYEETSTIQAQKFRRLNVRTNLNAKLSKRLKVGMNLNIGREERDGIIGNLSDALAFSPTTFAFNEEGELNLFSENDLGTTALNPLVPVNFNLRESTTDRYNITANLNYDIVKNLVANISAGVVRSDIHNNSYSSLRAGGIGRANVDNIYRTNLFNTNRLTYTVDLGERSNLKIDAVHELVINQFNRADIDASNFFTDLVTFRDLSAAQVQIAQNNESRRELESFLGRANLSLLDRYLFTASIRADGTSIFQNDRVGYFPSASFAWKINQEEFLKDSKSINNLKLRLSYGQVGNQSINVFGTRERARLDEDINYPFEGNLAVGVAPSNRLANPDLTWETTEQINAGLDLGLWNSAVTFSFDYYKKNTTDLLLDTQLPDFVGPTRQFVNAGEILNEGIDINLGTRILRNDDWNINSTLTISRNRNEVLALNDGLEFIEIGQNVSGFSGTPLNATRIEVGRPISSLRGFIFDGVWQLGEEDEAAAFGRIPGDARFRDISGPDGVPDGVITTDDITVVGDANPDFTWGWNWDISYKNLNLNFLLTGSQGNDIYNLQNARLLGVFTRQTNPTLGAFRNRWSTTNPSNVPARVDGAQTLSSQFIEDGSFVSMKNIVFSYNFNQKVTDALGINNARLYASAQNLFIITDYSGFDPETTASVNNEDVDLGLDINSVPLNRTITLGLNVSF